MLSFVIRRLVEAVFVLLTVALLAFVLFRFVGDPVNQMVGQDTSLEDRLKLREQLGLNDPVPVQFGRFVWKAAQFDFGLSYQLKQPVLGMIAERLPATLELALAAAVFAVAVGIPMGVYTGIHRNSWLSRLVPDDLARRHLAADLPDRHPSDLHLRRHARRGCPPSAAARS